MLSPEETAIIVQTVEQYNNFIRQQADQLGWAYLDPNVKLLELKTRADSDLSEREQQRAVRPYFSLDGVHPSSAAHRLVAQEAAAAINAVYGTNLQVQ